MLLPSRQVAVGFRMDLSLLLAIFLSRCFCICVFITPDKAQLAAEEISTQLHTNFESNLNSRKLEELYHKVECRSSGLRDPERLLDVMITAIESKLNGTFDAIVSAKNSLESGTSPSNSVNTVNCCAMRHETTSKYSIRFRTVLNASIACETRNVIDTSAIEGKQRLLQTFKKNLGKSPHVTWQYYGTAQGHYLQFPANARVCNGSASFDPRFKSWYVEAATRMRTNMVLVIDRSSSMFSEGRMGLARQASVTVLDTLGPNDKVGVLAFSHVISKPSGCFGNVVAQALPKNLNNLRTWVKALTPRGATLYGPAFTSAFDMLTGVEQSTNNTNKEPAENLILFLTDGDPYDQDPDRTIFEAIRQGQNKLSSRARINVYGLGNSLANYNLHRLRRIASENNGSFTQIADEDSSQLRTIMGQYYAGMSNTVREQPSISVPHLDRDLGLVVTLSVACTRGNGNISGVVALDAPLDELMREVLQFSAGKMSYAVLIDNKGRTLLHPSVPKPTDHVTPPTFQPLSLYEPGLTADTLDLILKRKPGSVRVQTTIPVSRGDPLRDGVKTISTNATYMWSPVRGGTYVIILVIGDGDLETVTMPTFTGSFKALRSYYHRLDLTWNQSALHPSPVCQTNGKLMTKLSSTVKIVPEAYNDSAGYIYTPETAEQVEALERFFNDQTQQVTYKDLTEQARVDVILTAQLEPLWNASQHRDPDSAKWRYVGTEGGVFRVFPGLRMNKTYSHKRQPWYRRAITHQGKLTVSRASLDASSGYPGTSMTSLAKSFISKQCSGLPSGTKPVAGVIGLDLSKTAFQEMLSDVSVTCDPNLYDCYIMDDSGFLVSHIGGARYQVISRHVTQVFPWLAAHMATLGSGVLQGSWCNNLEDHRTQLFYTLDLPLNSTQSAPGAKRCRQFSLVPVPQTNVFFLILRTRNGAPCSERDNSFCRCHSACQSCTGHISSCQCPCSCRMTYDECTNSVTGLWIGTPCPASLPPPVDTPIGQIMKLKALRTAPPCPVNCDALTTEVQCNATSLCHWCKFSAVPSCSTLCRTNERVTITIPFPCNDFLHFPLSTRSAITQELKHVLQSKIDKLTWKALGSTVINKMGVAINIHGTTDGIPVVWFQSNITSLVANAGLVISVATPNGQRSYRATSLNHLTNLNVELFLTNIPSGQLMSLSDAHKEQVTAQLQTDLISFLGDTTVSRLHEVRFKENSVSFYLTNQGDYAKFPTIKVVEGKIQDAVKSRRLRLLIPSNTSGDATIGMWYHVVNVSTDATFEYLCRKPETSTSAPTSSTGTPPYSVSPKSPMISISTLPSEVFPTSHVTIAETGLKPRDVFILVVTILASTTLCPLILCLAYRRRRRKKLQRLSPEPETEIEQDFHSDVSRLTDVEFGIPVVDKAEGGVSPHGWGQTNGSQPLRKQSTSPFTMQPIWTRETQANITSDSNYPGKYDRKKNAWKIKVLAATRLQQQEKTSKLRKHSLHNMTSTKIRRVSTENRGFSMDDINDSTPRSQSNENSNGKFYHRNSTTSSQRTLFHETRTPKGIALDDNYNNSNNTDASNIVPSERSKIVPSERSKQLEKPKKYGRSKSTRDISMATFRINDNHLHANRRQSMGVTQFAPRHRGSSQNELQSARETNPQIVGFPVLKPKEAWSKGSRATILGGPLDF